MKYNREYLGRQRELLLQVWVAFAPPQLIGPLFVNVVKQSMTDVLLFRILPRPPRAHHLNNKWHWKMEENQSLRGSNNRLIAPKLQKKLLSPQLSSLLLHCFS